MTTNSNTGDSFDDAARDLEQWLAVQAANGTPEVVLVGLLYGYADAIKDHGYVPRSWGAGGEDSTTIDRYL